MSDQPAGGQSNNETDPNLSRAHARIARTDVRQTGDPTLDSSIDVDRSITTAEAARYLDLTGNRDFHVGDVVSNRHSGDRLLVTTTGTWESRFYELEHCPHELTTPADAARRALQHANRDLPVTDRTEARQHARDRVRTTRPLLTTDPPPPTVTEPATDELDAADGLDLCDHCGAGDGESPDDVVANYWDPTTQTTHLAHWDCADAEGWQLA
jgi:hypothetical protein